jgi:hypothetical protein
VLKIFETKTKTEKGGWIKCHSEELCNFQTSLFKKSYYSVQEKVKKDEKRDVARIREMRGIHRTL